MSEAFDPYRKWLGIPPKDQPPNHYRLLGIAHFEDDPDVIENAATRQMVHIRTFQSGKYSAASQKILNELAAALARAMDVRCTPEYGPERKINSVPRRMGSTEKAARVLGFKTTVGLEEGLSRLVRCGPPA